MICVCFWSQPAQHGWQISAAILCPNSFGKGAKPIAGRFWPQCLQLIFPAIDNLLARDYSLPLRKFRVPGFEFRVLNVLGKPELLDSELGTYFCAARIAAITSSSFGRRSPNGRTSRWRMTPLASITNTERATLPG